MKELNYKICSECGGKMLPHTMSKIFQVNRKEIEIKGIEGYQCKDCGEEVFTAKEIRMIDRLIRAIDDRPTLDILNLDETAEYLRVSNQTVYNMIRDGRIRAYKVGREWRFLRAEIMAYLDSTANESVLSMAAKGGSIDKHDLDIINKEIAKRKTNDE